MVVVLSTTSATPMRRRPRPSSLSSSSPRSTAAGPRRIGRRWPRVSSRCLASVGRDQSATKVELPDTEGNNEKQQIAIDQDLLGGQLKRRRAAEERAKRIQSEFEDLLEEHAKLVSKHEKNETELAGKNMRIESYASEVEDLAAERDAAVVARSDLESKFSKIYLDARTEVEAKMRSLTRTEWARERRDLSAQFGEARDEVAALQGQLARMGQESAKASLDLVEEARAETKRELDLQCQRARAETEVASRAATESAGAVVRVVSEQAKVRHAATKIKVQAKAAEKVVHDMKKQIECLHEENASLQKDLKRKEEELYTLTMKRTRAEKEAGERAEAAERKAQDSIRSVEQSFDSLRAAMEERVRAAEDGARESRDRVEGLVAEIEDLRTQLANQIAQRAEAEAKTRVLEDNLDEERSLIESQIEVRLEEFKKSEAEARAVAKAEASREFLRNQEALLRTVEEEQREQRERQERTRSLAKAALVAAEADRGFWAARATSLAPSPSPSQSSGVPGRAKLVGGAELRKLLAKGTHSERTGGETSEVFRGDWVEKDEAED